MKAAITILYVLWFLSLSALAVFAYYNNSAHVSLRSDYNDLVSGVFTGTVGQPVGSDLKLGNDR